MLLRHVRKEIVKGRQIKPIKSEQCSTDRSASGGFVDGGSFSVQRFTIFHLSGGSPSDRLSECQEHFHCLT